MTDASSAAKTAAPTVIDTVIDNAGEDNYQHKIQAIAEALQAWQGPIVLAAHVDPDGDALGSTLALKRALESLGKTVTLPLTPPRFLEFLAEPGELSELLSALPEETLLGVLDVSDLARLEGTPHEGAAMTVNIDHHGTNDRFGDLACVQPSKAATAQMVKDLIDALGVTWTPKIATPCLTGILTDTGFLRFGNTTSDVLQTVSDLIDKGVAYAELTDRLQWRHPDYFKMLGQVMSTVEFPLDGLMATAHVTHAMREQMEQSEDDSDDFVGLIRYAEGCQLAILFKERDDNKHGEHVKISVRSRGQVSAQAICVSLGGGGHVAAAGATLLMPLAEAKEKVLEAARRELVAKGLL
ncbi:MAG: DHH family phosphoesterase [Deinococcota bacterium]